MIINWRKERLNVIPITRKVQADKKAVVVNKIVLMPGYNEVDDSFYADLKKILKRHLDAGNVEFVQVDKGDGSKGKATAKTISDLPAEEAAEIVKKTNNPETLKKFKKAEKRDEVRSVIKDRQEEVQDFINKKPNKKDNK